MKGCHSCQAMMINGVFCHETGCPNKNYRPRVRKILKPSGIGRESVKKSLELMRQAAADEKLT